MDLPHETTSLQYILIIISLGFLIFHWFYAQVIPISLIMNVAVLIIVLNIGITLFTLPLLSLSPGPARKKKDGLLFVASGEYAKYIVAIVVPVVVFIVFSVFVATDD